jgi:hypothetical protein
MKKEIEHNKNAWCECIQFVQVQRFLELKVLGAAAGLAERMASRI